MRLLARLGGERRVVDEVAQGSRRRVLVGEPEQEQLLEARGRGPVADVGELGRDGVEQVVEDGLADRLLDDVRSSTGIADSGTSSAALSRAGGRSRGAARTPRARPPGRSARPAGAWR